MTDENKTEQATTETPAAPDNVIRMNWRVDDSVDPPLYQLASPQMEDLVVSVSSADVTERVARARLITMAFEEAEKRGLDPTRLRFKVNRSIY